MQAILLYPFIQEYCDKIRAAETPVQVFVLVLLAAAPCYGKGQETRSQEEQSSSNSTG
ncbi:MAG: hypothetical protein AVDCRST_MAG37-910 [uncultured Rubrobacteraceae bacterium]|uniref:Uncharacterized protein n=1 Tax=uncultured Rubrobacteraceae bacterium TaxID=349277 RepID=A0A6J4QAY1_9ACTN|nr:MAG: hypothetical protein AVDCRST_MAG37-910 [uncultured Rubrobacteraceae bacterium]